MPIVCHGDSVYLEYSIPKEIDQKIPKYFYFAMAGELCSISGPWLFDKINDGDGVEYYDLHSSTSGWAAAFYATCKKLDMMWLLVYKSSGISYFESVDFGEIMCERVAEEEVMQQIAELTDGKVDRAEKDKYFEYADNMYDTFCSVLDDMLDDADSCEAIIEEYQRRRAG